MHAAHSVYFQMLGEHGYVGLLIFLSLGLAAWSTARRTIALARTRRERAWAGQLARAFQVSLVGYAVGGAFVNIGYWDLMYYEIVIVVVACRLASASALAVPSVAVDGGVPGVAPPRADPAQPAGALRRSERRHALQLLRVLCFFFPLTCALFSCCARAAGRVPRRVGSA